VYPATIEEVNNDKHRNEVLIMWDDDNKTEWIPLSDIKTKPNESTKHVPVPVDLVREELTNPQINTATKEGEPLLDAKPSYTFLCRKAGRTRFWRNCITHSAPGLKVFEFEYDNDTGWIKLKLYRTESWGPFGSTDKPKIEAYITNIGPPDRKEGNKLPKDHKVKLTLQRIGGTKYLCSNARNRWVYYNDTKNTSNVTSEKENAFQHFLKYVLLQKKTNVDKFNTILDSWNKDDTDKSYCEQFGFVDPFTLKETTRRRRRRLVYCPTDDDLGNGDGLCTQADLDEFGPDSPALKALLRRKRRLVYRPIHRLAARIVAEPEKDKPP